MRQFDALQSKSRRMILKGCIFALTVMALLASSVFNALPAYAYIATPDSAPAVIKTNCYRNIIETADMLIIVYENTPYATPPAMNYSDAFVWRLIAVDGITELAQATGYNYNDAGYGYNVISFYFSAAAAPAWGGLYTLRQSGTLAAFAAPPQYSYSITATDYSTLTATADVKIEIAARILVLATDLNNQWALTTAYSLLEETEVGTALSIYGQAFFRGAIYGVQAMAPSIFSINITSVDTASRTWATTYVTALEDQYTGTYLAPAFAAGEGFFGVTYNLMGLLIVLIICVGLIFAHWYVSGGNLWRGMIESTPVLVIGSRLALFGLGELGLIAAIGWLYISAKVWKLI